MLSFRLTYIYRADLTKPLAPWKARVPLTIRIASQQDVLAAAELWHRENKTKKRNMYLSMLENGDKCFIAEAGGSIVGYEWLSVGTFWSSHDFIELGMKEVWCSDAYTSIEWRGKGIHTALLRAMLQWASEGGYQAAYSHVGILNSNSWKAHERLKSQLSGIYMGVSMPWSGKHWSGAVYGSQYPVRYSRLF